MEWRLGAVENMGIDTSFWKGRNVLLTGHTGFKGSWLSLWLNLLGANVTGYALKPPTTPSLFETANVEKSLKSSIQGDICDVAALSRAVQSANPAIIIHMAAQSLVRESYTDPVETYSTNVMGTVHLLEAARNTPSVKTVLNVTSDKCYENHDCPSAFQENDPMGGNDPYSSSKGCSELVSRAYRRSFLQDSGVALATARAGNVIGGGDWAKDRIVPDAIRAFIKNKPLLVRNPHAIRPWQHVLEPLSGYLMLCQQLVINPGSFSDAWNFGPDEHDTQPVSALVDIMSRKWDDNAGWHHDKQSHPSEAPFLKLDCTKSRTMLKWNPVWDLETSLEQTVEWFKAWHTKKDMHAYTLQQIITYQREHLKKQ